MDLHKAKKGDLLHWDDGDVEEVLSDARLYAGSACVEILGREALAYHFCPVPGNGMRGSNRERGWGALRRVSSPNKTPCKLQRPED